MWCAAFTLGYLLLLFFKGACAWHYLRRYPAASPEHGGLQVTLLQPILSGDCGLSAVLNDNIQELPEAVFFWLVDEDDVTARELTRSIAAANPSVRITVMVLPPPPAGVNPKLFKLEQVWRQVSTEVCVILDDDTRIPRRSLQALVDALEVAELSTGLPYYRNCPGIPTQLLAQFVNDNAALTYLPLLAFKPPVSINGMCYAMRKGTLELIGGFQPILRQLTDDLAVARQVRSRGGRLRQTPFPQEVETRILDLPQYARQMHRWFLFATLLIKSEPLHSALAITLLQGIHPFLLWAAFISMALNPGPMAYGALCSLLLVRSVVLVNLQSRLTGRSRYNLPLSVISELLQPFHLLHAVCVRTIQWRRRRYRVFDNSRFECQ